MLSHARLYFTCCQVSRNDPKCRNERVLTCHSHSRGDVLGKENGKMMVSVKNSTKVSGMSRGTVEPSGCVWLPCPTGGEEPPLLQAGRCHTAQLQLPQAGSGVSSRVFSRRSTLTHASLLLQCNPNLSAFSACCEGHLRARLIISSKAAS